MAPILPFLAACSDYDLQGEEPAPATDPEDSAGFDADTDTGWDNSCLAEDFPPEPVTETDLCVEYGIGGFEPIIEWEVPGTWVCSLPVVADLNGDGTPEIIANNAGLLTTGELTAYFGDGSGELFTTKNANTGFGSHPAVADVDDDGEPEIFIAREYQSSLYGYGEFSVIRISWDGNVVAESEHFTDGEFDYATGIAISDMDHDGSPEIVAGRAILNADLTTRGVGQMGRGCDALVNFGTIYGEGSNPAIADVDLDGIEEVVVGNAMYDPDGNTIVRMSGTGAKDGAVGIGNFDVDPEAEVVRVTYNEVAAYDTDGSLLWGPIPNPKANILSIPTIGDVDNDGKAEIITAGGNKLWVLNAEDGSLLWEARVTDESGATGASLFDFDADGILEVVYIDEVEMVAYNGTDGVVKFKTDKHASDTMYDYPVIADVDADGHAEIVVAHDGFYPSGISIYGDATDSWAPARALWNQHPYVITNINDDLTVPQTATPNHTTYNSFHSQHALPPGGSIGDELEAEILSICEDDCDEGDLIVIARGRNTGSGDVPAGVEISLYARKDGTDTLLATEKTTSVTPSLMSSEAITFTVPAEAVREADALYVEFDDNGSKTGVIAECSEENNGALAKGIFCE